MDYKRNKILWYVGLSLLLIVYTLILPRLGISNFSGKRFNFTDGIALMVFTIFLLSQVIVTKMLFKKGNIRKYNLSQFELIWKDKWFPQNSQDGSKKRLLTTIKVCAVLLPISSFLLYYLGKNVSLFESIPLIVWIIIAGLLTTLIGTSGFILIIGFISLKAPNPKLKVYREGLKYLNNFIEWSSIKYMNYPASFRLSRLVTNIRRRGIGAITTKTLRIMTVDNDVYLVQIQDIKGFEDSLRKINKAGLLV